MWNYIKSFNIVDTYLILSSLLVMFVGINFYTLTPV